MSRIGGKPISLRGAVLAVKEDLVSVKGPKGELSTPLVPGIQIKINGDIAHVSRDDDEKQTKAFHGMMRALIDNMVTGVTSGFEKQLEIVGVGYRAQVKDKKLILNLGYSNPVEFDPPKGIEVETDGPTKIKVKGIDKQQVGQVSAIIRGFRPPEPYKGKGIRYAGEHIIRKAGKAGA